MLVPQADFPSGINPFEANDQFLYLDRTYLSIACLINYTSSSSSIS